MLTGDIRSQINAIWDAFWSGCVFARRRAAVKKLKTAHRAVLTDLDVLFASLQRRVFRGDL